MARIAQGAELAGIARRALELTREYLTTRVQFGKPIGSFQALQHRLVDGLIQVELADGLPARRPSATLTDDADLLASAASRVKARCAHAAPEMTRMAIQLHGAIGTTNEYDIGLYFKRAMTLASRWGNAAAHRRRYAAARAARRARGRRRADSRSSTSSRATLDWDSHARGRVPRDGARLLREALPRAAAATCPTGRPGPSRRTGT